MEYIFSIIIPHYNTPKLLVRCVNSIPIKDDIQVIVVDDCSPGAEYYLKDYPELSRPNLEFYATSQSGSAGRARNVGLGHARGKWILFADADDLFVDGFEDMLSEKQNTESDIIYFRKKTVMSSDLKKNSERSSWSDMYIDEYFRTGSEIELRRSFYAPWCKLIRRSVVIDNNIRFDETRYSNDAYFSVSVGIFARKIEVENRPLYILTEREGSLTDNYCMKPGEIEERAEVCLRVQQLLKKHGFPMNLLLLADYTRMFSLMDKTKYKCYVDKVRMLNITFKMFLRELIYDYKRGLNCRAYKRFFYELYMM